MSIDRRTILTGLGVTAAGGLVTACSERSAKPLAKAAGVALLNVSYDPTRELYKDINAAFAAHWKQRTGETLTINQSHGGSGKQARSVIDGLEADVVTLALAADIDEIARRAKLLPTNWQGRLPENSTPYTSTIVLLVRKGDPKGIRDWPDLVKPGVGVITANPKTGGGARWCYLSVWVHGLAAGGEPAARAYIEKLYRNVPVLDSGARGSTTTFAQRGIGDAMICWENEAYLTIEEFGPQFEIVYPSISMLAEPSVALLDVNVDRHRTREQAQAYLQFLYTPPAQDIIGKRHYRPRNPTAAARYPHTPMKTIRDLGGWDAVQAKHFVEGAIFDQIYRPG